MRYWFSRQIKAGKVAWDLERQAFFDAEVNMGQEIGDCLAGISGAIERVRWILTCGNLFFDRLHDVFPVVADVEYVFPAIPAVLS